jgi:hypothetical protein
MILGEVPKLANWKNFIKNSILRGAHWLKPIILATGETEIWKISGILALAKSFQDPISTNSWVWWHVPVIANYMGD